jgi:hypothetical protein
MHFLQNIADSQVTNANAIICIFTKKKSVQFVSSLI